MRLVESSLGSSRPALKRFFDLLIHAFFQAGHYFSEEANGVAKKLPDLLTQAGYQQVETQIVRPVIHYGTKEYAAGREDASGHQSRVDRDDPFRKSP